jgi:outer membrane protein assembly factor BamB
MTRRFTLAFTAACLLPMSASASDWANWRGPFQNGVSPDKNLPAKFSLDPKAADNNLIWRVPHGCRSTPLILGDRVYLINYVSEKVKQGNKEKDVPESIRERVMCLDANTGKTLWEHAFPVFHTDIVTVRLGWTNLAADPVTGYIYAHGTAGLFFCLDGKSGKVIWSKSMSEEYGRITGYGGRVTSPVIDEDLVILGMVNSSWGDQAKGGNRLVAMNKRTGEIVWWSDPAGAVKDTYYSVPVIATINGQRLLISGGADGSVFAVKVRTGEPVWRYVFATGAINCSPVVDGNHIYIGHGEENPDNNELGRVICLDGSKVEKKSPKLVWKVDGLKARYTSPVIHEGRLYITNDIGKLYCLDAKTGEQQWKYNYGRNSRGSPVLADGKIYIGEVNSYFHILEPGAKQCTLLHKEELPALDGVSDTEINGSPAVANGRVFFSSSDEVFCIGLKKRENVITNEKIEQIFRSDEPITHLQVVPAEIALHPGQSATFKVRAFDASGRFVKEVKAEWSLPAQMPPKGVKATPPALKGDITTDGKLTVDAKMPAQGSIVVAKFDGLVGKARVRVAPTLPYANDFEKLPDGAVPGGWVNTQGKFVIKTVNGNKVLAKVNTKPSPLVALGNAYITLSTAKDYTIECDVQGTQVGDDLPDIGIVANRYTLILDGKLQKLRILSWEALPRIDQTVQFDWKPNTWYRLKLTTDIKNGKGVIRGKAWPRDQKEPAAWTVEATDAYAIGEGSAALYGGVQGVLDNRPGTEIYYDNLRITPNQAGGKAGGPGQAGEEPTSSSQASPRLRLPLLWRLRR